MDQETLTIKAAKVYADSIDRGQWAVRAAIAEADHDGWMRGFEERSKMADAFWRRMWPLVLANGFAIGALYMVMAPPVIDRIIKAFS